MRRSTVVKLKPHHPLAKVQEKFATIDALQITVTALMSAQAINYSRQDVVDAVQALTGRNFVKSETAHSPPNSKIWHDTYRQDSGSRQLYLKFAGETLVDVTLVSFKEARR